MSPIFATFSLVVALGANLAPGQLSWEQNYRQARELGGRLQKPLAVFVGSGAQGWCKLAQEGRLDSTVQKSLTDNYVRVYVDVNTEYGKKVAAAFGITGSRGLVISDRTGDLQAFWHDGDLALTDLSKILNRFGAREHVVRTTETHQSISAQVNAGFIQPASYQNYYQPVCRT